MTRDELYEYLNEKYKPEKRQKLSESLEGPQWLAGLNVLGAGLAGRDPIAAGKAILDIKRNKLEDFDVARKMDEESGIEKIEKEQEDYKSNREKDPNSQESILARDLAKKMLGNKLPTGMGDNTTAFEIKGLLPNITKIYDIEQSKLEKQNAAQERAKDRNLVSQEKKDMRNEQQNLKNQTIINEVTERANNIRDNLQSLRQMVIDKGTFEVFGSHNTDLNRKMDQVATDMAKLADPGSVARPSEVEMFKKGLFAPTDFKTNATALELLDNFEKEIDNRVRQALINRGVGAKERSEEIKGEVAKAKNPQEKKPQENKQKPKWAK